MHKVSVLFVCMGNICRSPMAEAVFREHVKTAGLEGVIHIDSAGTHSYHLGHTPHPETQAELALHAIPVGDQVSRLVTPTDIENFNFILAMDKANLKELNKLQLSVSKGVAPNIDLFLSYAPNIDEDEVPDPYYVGGYDKVFELVSAASEGLLTHLQETIGPSRPTN